MTSILAVVGLDVSFGGTIEAAPDAVWRFELPARAGRGVWIATSARSVWVAHADGADELHPAELLLLAPGVAAQRSAVSTDFGAVDPPADPTSDPFFALLGVRPTSGVVYGTFALGPLAEEAVALPRVHIARQRTGVGDVTRPALDLVASRVGARPGEALDDAIARVLVVAAIGTWLPPYLRDASLRRSIEYVLAAEFPPAVGSIPPPRRCSRRNLYRRFRASTGRTPGAFVRWWTSVRARALLARGVPDAEVASMLGYADVRSLRRMLGGP